MNSLRLRRWLGCAAAAGVAVAAWSQLQKGEEFSGFRVPDYDEQGNLKMMIQGEQARIISADEVEIQNFRIDTYQNGAVDARVTAPHCIYNNRTRKAQSTNDIRIVRGTMIISGTDFNWDPGPQRFEIHQNAKVVFRGLKNAMDKPLIPEGKKP